MRRLRRVALEASDGRVFEAATVRERLAKAPSRQPDAILLDLGLPEMDGTEQSQYLRVFLSHIRRKLAAAGFAPEHIRTETGVGYRLVALDG